MRSMRVLCLFGAFSERFRAFSERFPMVLTACFGWRSGAQMFAHGVHSASAVPPAALPWARGVETL